MAILQTFTRTLPTPSATHSGFVFLLSTGWFTQADGIPRGSPIDGGTYSIANGGGDLQAYSDEACTVRVPVEVVEFVTGGTPSAQVWVRLSSYATGDKITIAKDSVQTVQPAVTDTYGRNAVWVDYLGVYHLYDYTDSSGNADLQLFNGNAAPTLLPSGKGYDFGGTDQMLYAQPVGLATTSLPFTL